MRFSTVLLLSGILRLGLVIYGEWQDRNLEVPFTDIDYQVFTDAARFVAAGESPYQRLTYRYTPLLAYLLLGNIWLHPAWGKVVFSAADLLVGNVIHKMVLEAGHSSRAATRSALLWLLNPFTCTISTRGSSDALVGFILLSVLLCVQKKQFALAGVLWGFAVHWRVFPIIYGPSIVAFLALKREDSYTGQKSIKAPQVSRTRKILSNIISVGCITFVISAVMVFAGLGVAFFYTDGYQFLQETYLHHLTRRDPRHNFSVYFYPIYLHGHAEESFSRLSGNLDVAAYAFGPPAMLMLLASWKLADHLPFCWLIITMIFVAFNKVCTAQYFIWYFCIFPTVAPQMSWPPQKGLMLSFGFWLATQFNWLAWAYLLEFKGISTYPILWTSSCAFLLANSLLIKSLLHSYSARQPICKATCNLERKQM